MRPEESNDVTPVETQAAAHLVTAATIPVRDMACESCVEAIEEILGGLPGVEEVRVSLEEGRVQVRYDEGMVTSGRLADALRAERFEVGTPSTEVRK